MRLTTGLLAALALSLPNAAMAASIVLDFGASSQPGFSAAGDLRMEFVGVATDINASMTADAAYDSNNPTNNGSASGDARINSRIGGDVIVRLELWDATVGTGFESLYDPGVDFSWKFAFYDIDGRPATFDVLTVFTPGTYTLSGTSNLVVNATGQSTSFSGIKAEDEDGTVIGTGPDTVNNGDIPGQEGLQQSGVTQLQADYMVIYEVENTSVIDFGYAVGGNRNSGRNLLIDGGELNLDDFDPKTSVTPVPLPMAGWMMLAGLGTLVTMRRMRKISQV